MAQPRLLICILGALIVLGGCHPSLRDGGDVDRAVIGEVMMRSQFSANLRALCMPGGRLSGSPNGRRSEEYVASKLAEYGMDEVRFEPFEMLSWQDRKTVVTVLGDPPEVLDGALSLGNCLSTPPEGITAELVSVGGGSREEFDAVGERLHHKFGIVREGGLHRGVKMSIALTHGAAGLVQVSPLADRARVGQCHSTARPEPGITIIGSNGTELMDRLAGGGTVQLNIKIDADCWESTPRNVVGEIAGSGPLADEVVILGAHLDSWHLAEGAMDNGSGSAVILEAARALRAVGWHPRRTVRFVWFMGEEHGLCGSEAYVRDHADELDRIVAMVNVDMPGEPRRFATFGHPEIVEFLGGVRADLAGFEIAPDIANATWTASDHGPFMKQGVCALTLSGELGPGVKYYHSTGDTFESVDLPGTTGSAAVLAVLVRRLADCPERPSVRLDPARLAEEMGWEEW